MGLRAEGDEHGTSRQEESPVHDMTLRDGMHPKRHLMTLEQMKSDRRRPG